MIHMYTFKNALCMGMKSEHSVRFVDLSPHRYRCSLYATDRSDPKRT